MNNMNTPILDFICSYILSDTTRFHMPGHKGRANLGCEVYDITEIKGADSLYEANSIIAESEANASALFGSGQTLYSTEGSSQCIKAMLYLAMQVSGSRTVVAARNVHKSFVDAAALLDLDVVWVLPENASNSVCSCVINQRRLKKVLRSLPEPPAAVYITNPDYLGGQSDIKSLAQACHEFNTILAVDNAHGAYLHFLANPKHPLDLGADICCDSAHKTLPVLTGGAYLHINKNAEPLCGSDAKSAMALFGSTSPSYLTLTSLDCCNRYLSGEYQFELKRTVRKINSAKKKLIESGWSVYPSDPLKITLTYKNGILLADKLRACGFECEYADSDHIVFMITQENDLEDIDRLVNALIDIGYDPSETEDLPIISPQKAMNIRQAVFSQQEKVSVNDAVGKVCASPLVSCPPAIPIVISGEIITDEAVDIMSRYGISDILVVK